MQWIKKIGLTALLFFTIKGLIWLLVAGLIAVGFF